MDTTGWPKTSGSSRHRLSQPISIEDFNASRCPNHEGQVTFWLKHLPLDSLRWTSRNSSNSSCMLTTSASGNKSHTHAMTQRNTEFLSECSKQNYVIVKDDVHDNADPASCQPGFLSYYGNTSGMVVNVGDPRTLLSMTIKARSVDYMEMTYITAVMGHLKLPPVYDFPENSLTYPDADCWVSISVPWNHVMLTSFQILHTFDVAGNRVKLQSLELYSEGTSRRNIVWRVTSRQKEAFERILPEVYETRVMYLRYGGNVFYLGFQLLFSFHVRPYKPSRVDIRFWNCSVAEWPHFQRHFLCNLVRECDGGEDENRCDYTGACGQGHLTVADRYKGTGLWADRTIHYFDDSDEYVYFDSGVCWYASRTKRHLQQVYCRQTQGAADFLCEFDPSSGEPREEPEPGAGKTPSHIHISPVNATFAVQFVLCPAGHWTHGFLACDVESACFSSRACEGAENETFSRETSGTSHEVTMTSFPVMFQCGSGRQRVPYSVVCDHRKQCLDGGDESFCVFQPCSGSTPVKCAASDQCIPASAMCDNQGDCEHDTDEIQCVFSATALALPPPAVVRFTHPKNTPFISRTLYTMYPFASACPRTHFQCPDHGYCLPVFLRCNGVSDCPGREDEAGCDVATTTPGGGASCPGFYRCRSSGVCLHPSHVCDDWYQCPQQDDERFCGLTCPRGCACHGLAYACHEPRVGDLRSDAMRYLDASGSGLTLERLRENTMLVRLSLSRCGLKIIHNVTFPNLLSLDLSRNELYAVSPDHFRGMLNLRHLSLSNNRLESPFSEGAERSSFPALSTLDLSGVRMLELNAGSLSYFSGLRTLNLSFCGIDRVTGEGLRTTKLRVLDISGCPMVEFPRDLLSSLVELRTVKSDNFKICCPDSLPAGFITNCMAPFNEVSSCESLLRSDVYVVFLSLFSSFALLGNLGCFVTRSLCTNRKTTSGFGVFVTHLSISDFLMGVYLAIIGVADRLYKGSYLWEDLSWRRSASCKAAGFLSLLSSEVSAFIICLITLDRFLVLRFPFSSLRFQARSAHVTCAAVWLLVTIVVVVPLTPATSHWSFFGQTGICIPLPVSRVRFAGSSYAFGVMIVFNFILFLLIAAGQAAIYISVRANRLSSTESGGKKSNDLRIARRLISVAVSDFLCWFPVGLLGLMAFRGAPIPSEVNVSLAILVLPLNSAVNPFLYTVNVLMERRRSARDEKLFKEVMSLVREEET